MIKNNIGLALMALLTFAVFTAPALAEDKSDGCGLGWQVTKKTSFSATSTRGTTNAFIPPTFGMTSGTLGCAQHSIAKKEEDAARYAVNNRETLMMEMAAGQGENLTAFARTFGCEDSVVPRFGTITQQNYSEMLSAGQASGLDLFDAVKARVKADTTLAARCSAV